MTKGVGINAGARAMEFLGRAYDLAEGGDTFEAMYDAAAMLFFATVDGHALDPDFPAEQIDAAFIRHLDRLARSDGAGSSSALATLVIERGSETVDGNSPAEALVGRSLPAGLSELDFTAATQTLLREYLQGMFPIAEPQDLVLTRSSDQQNLHARACLLGNGSRLMVTFAHFAWTEKQIARIAARFGLTKSETEVFGGLLCGKTQSVIATERGRSVETIRVQAKTILRKTGTARVSELVPLAFGLLLLEIEAADGREAAPKRGANAVYTPRQRAGFAHDRSVGMIELGPSDGRPVLMVHGLPYGPFFSHAMTSDLTRAGYRLAAVSRPGFGRSDPAPDGVDFDALVVEDALRAVELAWPSRQDRLTILAHQGGASHACRIARALGTEAEALVMVGAGIPILDHHLSAMPKHVRVAAAASRHTPRVMELILRLGVPVWMRRGPSAYLRHLFDGCPADMAALENPAFRPVLEAGILHMVEQGPHAFVSDGAAAMADWTDDYRAVPCPIHWIIGDENPVLSAADIDRFTQAEGRASFDLIPGGGSTLLFTHFREIMEIMREIAPV